MLERSLTHYLRAINYGVLDLSSMVDKITELPVIRSRQARKATPKSYLRSGQKPQSRKERFAGWLKSKVIEAITDERFPESEALTANNGLQDLEVTEVEETPALDSARETDRVPEKRKSKITIENICIEIEVDSNQHVARMVKLNPA